MLQCENCEYFSRDGRGRPVLACDPFGAIKEPECLLKWQFLRLDQLHHSYEALLDLHRRLAPLQERMMKHMERELDEADQADTWKRAAEDEEGLNDNDNDNGEERDGPRPWR